MKCILISVLCLMVCPYFSDANWCIQETTTNMRVTKALTKIITSRKWFGGVKRKTVSYVVTELVPRTRQHRVCCEGYTMDSVQRICEPSCPVGCPQFSGCVRPKTCECYNGYQMKGNSCEPICEPTCAVNAFCSRPNGCLCRSGFEYNDSTKSCDPDQNEDSTIPDGTSTPALPNLTVVHSESTAKSKTISKASDPPATETSGSSDIETSSSTSTPKSLKVETTATSETDSSIQIDTDQGYQSRKVHCTSAFNCDNGHCRLVLDNCKCNEGFVKADSACHFKSGFKPDECVEESICNESTTEEYGTSTEPILSSGSPDTSFPLIYDDNETYDDVSSNCENGCFNGICINEICECPQGSVFSQKSNDCVSNSSCDKICLNGICQENGLCECLKGFVYQYDKGCVPHCEQECTNGICSAPGECECLDGFEHNSENLFECITAGKLYGKLERHTNLNFPWLWVVSAMLVIVIFGLFLFKKARKHNYNVDKVEKDCHIVQFDCKGV